MLVPWTPLSPSRRELGVRRAALVLGLASAVSLLAAAARSEQSDLLPVLAALGVAVTGAVAMRFGTQRRIEVGVDRDGRLAARRADRPDTGPEQRLRCVFAAPWLITLKFGTMWIPIWPDSVPRDTFRRLWVHIRWNSGRERVALSAGSGSGQPR